MKEVIFQPSLPHIFRFKLDKESIFKISKKQNCLFGFETKTALSNLPIEPNHSHWISEN